MDMASLSPRKTISRRQLLGFALGSSLLLACSALSNPVMAGDSFITQCHTPTPSITSRNHPGVNKIILSNNLARPAGKVENAPGQLLYISGRVTDEKCVPIANAIVDVWQANPFGDYRWAARDELLTPEPVFAGTGRAVTDNMGHYQFITLFPGSYGRKAPHISMRITHPDFDALNTAMYFRGDRRNETDPHFRTLKPQSRELLLGDVSMRQPTNHNAGLQSTFNIVLKGATLYRGY